jgi:LmbE family N-acetylglucosaminyl deacetylase
MKISKLILMIGLLGSVISCQPKETGKPKTILVVLAHPDDETGFGSALAYYARLGHTVKLIFAVDARFDRRFVDAELDSVAKAKQRDVVCSCEKLGIASPIFYSFNTMDRKHGERDGVRNAVETGSAFREKLKQSIEQLKPDLIITFGPDGEYGHPEHIIVSSLVTELLLREGWSNQYPLYYFGWTKSQEEDGDGWVRYADDKYFNVVVNYSDEDEQRAFQSIQCYTSGFSQEEMNEMISFEQQRKNEVFFRKFVTEEGIRTGFF